MVYSVSELTGSETDNWLDILYVLYSDYEPENWSEFKNYFVCLWMISSGIPGNVSFATLEIFNKTVSPPLLQLIALWCFI